ncbi:MAG: Cd(II)/Pb(II)-responsive transcriptional regulator [Mycobacteriales bacterium]
MRRTVDVPLDWKVKPYAAVMRIGDLAARAGVTTKALRFYEQAGVLPGPARTPSGYRDYDDTALARLRFVKAAQAAGLSLAEIVQVVAVREAQGPPCGHVTALLDGHAADLDTRIAELTAARAEVERLRERAAGLDPADCAADGVCHVIPAR